MYKSDPKQPRPVDYAMAMQELKTTTDASAYDLMRLQRTAERHARIRNTDSLLVENLMTFPVITVSADCSLSAAAHMMVTRRISGLPVVDDQQRLMGVITEADFLRALGIPSHYPSHSLWHTLEHLFRHQVKLRRQEGQVSDLMITDVITIAPGYTLRQTLDVMKQYRIKRILVCDEKRHVLGLITRSDLVRVFFDHFKHDRRNVEDPSS